MKNLILLVCLSCGLTLSLEAQRTKQESIGKNEIKLNSLFLVLGTLDFAYERLLTEETTLGVSAYARLDDESIEYRFGIIPYFRVFFGKKKPASGFFIEANAALYSADSNYATSSSPNWDSPVGAGLGIGVGAKFLTKNNWIGEILLGVGRNFANTDTIEVVYPRVGILMGKRF